jgi:hypothetical protein
MKTQQAHSLHGRGAAPRRPRTAQRAVPTLWLNLVCLDAPLVAVAWLWLFARTFRIPLHVGNSLALFLTAWLIYLGDRLADSASLEPDGPQSLRQQFCRRHRKLWIIVLALAAGFDAYIIWRTTALETLLAGAVVGGLALIYLVLNHPLGLIWRSLPAKELVIGLLFSAGILVALLPALKSVTAGLAIPAVFFAILCALNCISIARWEYDLDRAQGKVSIATRHPGIARYSGHIALALGVAAFVMTTIFPPAAPLLVCIGVSGFLLAWLNSRPIDTDRQTALADLVLLTPIIPMIATAL